MKRTAVRTLIRNLVIDMIVLGSSVSSIGLVRVMMGNLTREVFSRAQRPVLVVRPPVPHGGSELGEVPD